MVEKYNMVFGPDRWNAVKATRRFGEVCAGYDSEEAFWGLQEDIPGLTKDTIFLDVGCGPGRAARNVFPLVKHYHGVDIHQDLLDIAIEHYADVPNVSFVKTDGQDLSMFESDFFDYVYERLMFIHITKENIEMYLHEMFRVLKPGGILFIPDLPAEDIMVNGLTEEEVRKIFSSMKALSLGKTGTWQVECIK